MFISVQEKTMAGEQFFVGVEDVAEAMEWLVTNGFLHNPKGSNGYSDECWTRQPWSYITFKQGMDSKSSSYVVRANYVLVAYIVTPYKPSEIICESTHQ